MTRVQHLTNAEALWVPRAPCFGPRQRTIDAAVLSRLQGWLSELGVGGGAPVQVEEWVALDSRQTPHQLVISWRSRGLLSSTTLCQASERISWEDLASRFPRRIDWVDMARALPRRSASL